MLIRIETTVDGKTGTQTETVQPCDVQELADWYHNAACDQHPDADRIHVRVTTWVDSDEDSQDVAEMGWK